MTVKFTVHSDQVEEFPSKKGGMQKTRRLMLLDASDGARLDQILEMNLPAEHAAVGVGKAITVEVQEISAIFAGRPRIRGRIVTAKA